MSKLISDFRKYYFGAGKLKWQEDNPIIEIYKDQQKKRKAQKKLFEILDKGFNITDKVYISRNELYEERTSTL